MQRCKQFFTRKNLGFLLLFLAQIIFLLARFAGDFATGPVIDVTPDLLVPYAEECTNDDRGARVENFTGLFATTRWIDIPAGSYQVAVTYVNNGDTGQVDFLNEIMPCARYDAATLPAGNTRTVFSLWMPYECETAQLQFTADCGEGQVMYITGAQLVPTHAFAYVHFLTAAVFFFLLDWALLVATRRLPFPLRSVKARYSMLALAAIVAFACLPLGLGYLTYAHDQSIHLSRIEGLKAGLLAGQFPVRMDPALLDDRGYPFSLMYADLLLYPAAILRIIGFSLQAVYKLYVAAITLGTALITRHVLRKMLGSERLALLGTALYVLSFYRLSNIFVRGALGEYTAMMFLPLVIYGLWRIYTQAENGAAWCWLGLAVGFSGIVQSHLLTAEMAGLFTALFCLLRWRKTFTKPVFGALCKAVGAAVLWNLWFLVPLLHYMALGVCQVSSANDATILFDKATYVGQIFLMFGPGQGFAESLGAGLSAEMPITIGAALALGGGLFLLALLDPAVRRASPALTRFGSWCCGLAALALWMSTDIFPWYDLYRTDSAAAHLFAKLQFSWRFLALATALLAVGTGCALALLRRVRPELAKQAAAALLALTVLPAGYLLYDVCRSSDVVYYQSLGAINNVPDQVGGGEYLPGTMENTDLTYLLPQFPAEVVPEAYNKEGLSLSLTARNEGGDASVTLPLLAYPGYTLTADGGAALGEKDGYLTLELPAGWQGSAGVRWTGFWFWRAADLVSLVSLAATAVLWRRRRGRR